MHADSSVRDRIKKGGVGGGGCKEEPPALVDTREHKQSDQGR